MGRDSLLLKVKKINIFGDDAAFQFLFQNESLKWLIGISIWHNGVFLHKMVTQNYLKLLAQVYFQRSELCYFFIV